MHNLPDLVTLSWCLGEIRQCLDSAEQQLESYLASDQSGIDLLRMARNSLHQAHGALQVVDVPGVSLLTSEAEALVNAVEQGEQALTAQSLSLLGAAFRSATEYLEALLAGSEVSALSLFPYLRDLLEARGAKRIHPADLYFPDLSRRPRFAATLPVNEEVDPLQIRQQFERGLLKHLKENDARRGGEYMAGAISLMTQWKGAQNQRQFWQLVLVFMASFQSGKTPEDVYNKRLLARLNLQVRATLEQQPIADRLFSDLLFAIACVPRGVPMVDETKAAWQLPTIAPEDYETRRYATQDLRFRRKAHEAILEVKLAWEKIARAAKGQWLGSGSDAQALNDALARFNVALERLTLPGLGYLMQSLEEVRKVLGGNGLNPKGLEALAIEGASAILFVEHVFQQPAHELAQLDAHCAELGKRLVLFAAQPEQELPMPPWLKRFSQAAEERSTIVSFVRELQSSLKQAESALDAYFRDTAQIEGLQEAARLLEQTAGAFMVLGHEQARLAAQSMARQIAGFSVDNADPRSFETLAGNMGVLGFFVEALLQPASKHQRFEFDAQSETFRMLQGSVTRLIEDPLFQLQAELQTVSTMVEPERQAPAETHHQLAAPVSATESPVAEPQNHDAELVGIFIEEATEVAQAIAEQARGLEQSGFIQFPQAQESLVTIRRGFHTLKGSSRMVGLTTFGNKAWAFEQLLNLWLAQELAPSAQMVALVLEAQEAFSQWIELIRIDTQAGYDMDALTQRAQSLGREVSGTVIELIPESVPAIQDFDPIPTHDSELQTVELPDAVSEASALYAASGVELPLEFLASSIGLPATEQPAESQVVIGERSVSRALFEIFMAEAQDRISAMQQVVEVGQVNDDASIETAVRSAHSLAGAGALVGLGSVRSMSLALEETLNVWRECFGWVGDEPAAQMRPAIDGLHRMLHQVAAGAEPGLDDVLLVDLANLQAQMRSHTAVAAAPVSEFAEQSEVKFDAPEAALDLDAQAEVADSAGLKDEIDQELASIFFVEAQDILPGVGEQLAQWQSQPDDMSLGQSVMRGLHTVKGGARMAGAMRLGQTLHEMETEVEDLLALGRGNAATVDELIQRFDKVMVHFEHLVSGEPMPVEEVLEISGINSALQSGSAEFADTAPLPELGSLGTDRADVVHENTLPERDHQPAEPVQATAQASVVKTPAVALPQTAHAAHLLRVRADLLDRIVNEAGEVSIARSRLDNELTNIRQALSELTENVHRLRTQLREVEIQAESQIEAQLAQHKDQDRNFDPLEFDRYTRFQELTRMLAESVNDVATVQQNAHRNLEAATADLKRQGQSMRELQQHLMQVRMVQFGSMADRLYRVVRQASKDAGKRVNLDVVGAAAEMDRNVLERMVAPIEHLLRNSVAHGIEAREVRLAAGKPEVGQLGLRVEQQGNEVVLAFSDDGAGLNMPRIRARAIEQGLISASAELSDAETAQLIFAPGFSTAAQVTELAGRGVGMDVVRATVTDLGGRIEIETEAGMGTVFTVRLPLSLALAQVTLVSAGTHHYAINTSAIEQVIPMKPQQLAEVHRAGHVVHGSERVPVHYLGHLTLGEDATPTAQHQSPVLVVQLGTERVALHVDAVGRNQEVVIKHVGVQIAAVPGVAGATILGDGEIVLIINPLQLANTLHSNTLAHVDAMVQAAIAELPPTVMVVDDSVTVRKVTQRLLSREGYQVQLAKDGLDALRQLEEQRPDVMLLDIEMPRMDGFDLARNLRADPRFASLPIIMISSRTGDKHRGIAQSIGVNHFLGKPYDEDSLLHLIQRYVDQKRLSQTSDFTTV